MTAHSWLLAVLLVLLSMSWGSSVGGVQQTLAVLW